jgi:hypothetical protein
MYISMLTMLRETPVSSLNSADVRGDYIES